jgi:hypothetical protein
MPWTRGTDLAMSRPTMVASCMLPRSASGQLQPSKVRLSTSALPLSADEATEFLRRVIAVAVQDSAIAALPIMGGKYLAVQIVGAATVQDRSIDDISIKPLPLCGIISVSQRRVTAMKGSEWRAERNYRSLERLERALPQIFPKPVLIHALARPLVPPLPRLAIDSYWRSHPLLADRLARALAAKTGAPPAWTWTVSGSREPGLGTTFRAPPAPYREAEFKLGPGRCCVCGQLVYRFGWHVDLWKRGPNRNVEWHAACVAAWRLWAAPRTHLQMLKRLQLHRCAETGKRLSGGAEVDHRIPLHRVWQERRADDWPSLLAFWGVPNLQVINRDAHAAKCLAEVQARWSKGAGQHGAASSSQDITG